MATTDALITAAQGYAASIVEQADAAIARMNDDINNIGFTLVSFSGTNLPAAPEIPGSLTAPTLSPVNLELPTEPDSAPTYQEISPIEPGEIPVLDAAAPELTFPTLPSQLAEFVETVPAITTEFDFPDVPAALVDPFIPAPVLQEHVTPTAPTIALPSFDAVAPADNITAPSDISADFIAAYNDVRPAMVATLSAHMEAWMDTYNPQFHTQMARIEAQLATYLAGGTGLSPDVENAIYERAKGKELGEYRRTQRAAFKSAADRGFTIPDGAALSAIRKARQGASDNLARSSNEIAIKQAEMEQANLQFAVTASAALRNAALSSMLTYHGSLIQINAQALDYAKAVAQNIIQVYNLTIEAYRAKLESYRSEAQIYDTRVKAAMSYIDLYKAEIDALQALTTLDKTKVDVYRSRIDSLNVYASIYKTQVETIVQEASLEKMKIDLFRTKVDAYVAQVQGKRAEYDGYASAMSGQEALVKVHAAQVDAHNSEINGYRALIDAKATVVRAQSDTNQALALQYKSELDGYSTVVDARGKKAGIELDIQRAQLNVFDSQVRAITATTGLQSDVYKAQALIILENTKLEIETLIKNAQMNVERSRVVAELGVSSAKVYEGMAGAALSGMNTLVAQTLAQ